MERKTLEVIVESKKRKKIREKGKKKEKGLQGRVDREEKGKS